MTAGNIPHHERLHLSVAPEQRQHCHGVVNLEGVNRRSKRDHHGCRGALRPTSQLLSDKQGSGAFRNVDPDSIAGISLERMVFTPQCHLPSSAAARIARRGGTGRVAIGLPASSSRHSRASPSTATPMSHFPVDMRFSTDGRRATRRAGSPRSLKPALTGRDSVRRSRSFRSQTADAV